MSEQVGAWRSPNEMFDAAKEHMLGSNEPVTEHDWHLVINFWAYNLSPAIGEPALVLLCKIYDCPCPEGDVRWIWNKVQEAKGSKKES